MLNTKFKFETIHVKSDKIFPIVKMETNERTGEKYRVRPKLNEVVKAIVLNDMPLIEDGELPSSTANQLTICGVTFRFLDRKDYISYRYDHNDQGGWFAHSGVTMSVYSRSNYKDIKRWVKIGKDGSLNAQQLYVRYRELKEFAEIQKEKMEREKAEYEAFSNDLKGLRETLSIGSPDRLDRHRGGSFGTFGGNYTLTVELPNREAVQEIYTMVEAIREQYAPV